LAVVADSADPVFVVDEREQVIGIASAAGAKMLRF
jgi:hypothetical protein